MNRLKCLLRRQSGRGICFPSHSDLQERRLNWVSTSGKRGHARPGVEDPFAWPLPSSPRVSEVDKSNIDSVVKESAIHTEFIATIESEGGKIDINDLGSKIESLSQSTRQQILLIFETEMENNQTFNEKYYGTDFNEVFNNIQDWVDEDTNSINGGAPKAPCTPTSKTESSFPQHPIENPAGIAHDRRDERGVLPAGPNRASRFLESRVVNVNYAPRAVLMGLTPTMTEEAADEVIKRREDLNAGGPFKSQEDFFAFLQAQRVDTQPIEQAGIPAILRRFLTFEFCPPAPTRTSPAKH